jgi:hypothetical protein
VEKFKKIDEVQQKFKIEKQRADSLQNVIFKNIQDFQRQQDSILQIYKNKAEENLQLYTADLFLKKYPCYESLLDKSYGDRGVSVEGTKIGLKLLNPDKIYYATFGADGKLYWNDDSGKVTTTSLGC